MKITSCALSRKEPEQSSNCCVPKELDKWATLLKLRTIYTVQYKTIYTVHPFHMDEFINGKNASKPLFLRSCISPSSALRVEEYGLARGKEGVVLLPVIPLSLVASTKMLSKDHTNSHMRSTEAPCSLYLNCKSGQMLEKECLNMSRNWEISVIYS